MTKIVILLKNTFYHHEFDPKLLFYMCNWRTEGKLFPTKQLHLQKRENEYFQLYTHIISAQ